MNLSHKTTLLALATIATISCKESRPEAGTATKASVPEPVPVEDVAHMECSESGAEMESVTTCLFRNTSIQTVYIKTTADKNIAESQWMLQKLPVRDTLISVNEGSLIDLEYSVSADSITINASHQGGITTISIVKSAKGAVRTITSSAD